MKNDTYYVPKPKGVEIHALDGQSISQDLDYNFNRSWYLTIQFCVFFFLLLLLVRVFYLTILDHGDYALGALDNKTRSHVLPAVRGKIYDKSGIVLADNESNQSLILKYSEIDSLEALTQKEREMIFSSVADILQEDLRVILDVYEQVKYEKEDGVLVQQITREEAITYQASQLRHPAFDVLEGVSRVYKRGPLFAHVVGYEGLIDASNLKKKRSSKSGGEVGYQLTDRIGKSGLELYYEDVLHGEHGLENLIVNSREEVIRSSDVVLPVHGSAIHTNIDAALQEQITSVMEESLPEAGSNRGAAVALDPRDGSVLALVSLPLYDNNAFVHGIGKGLYDSWEGSIDKPLFNRAVAGVYPPGSTIKPMLGVAALAEKIVDSTRQIESRGGIWVGDSYFGDWRAHGFTDLRRAIAVSSDVYFYTVAGGSGGIRGMGIEKMSLWMRKFGFGSKSDIDLGQEATGLYPDPSAKKKIVGERWYTGDTYNTAIGQGFFTATPLQIANATAAIANGGTLYKPRIVDYSVSPDDAITVNPVEILTDMQRYDSEISTVQEGMRMTVTEGTARMMQQVPVRVAGKTGTAQFYGNDEKVHSWFSAYAPFDDPEIVLLILAEGQSGEISSATVPIAKDVLTWYFSRPPTANY
jgi:penicillin-binding protein 2